MPVQPGHQEPAFGVVGRELKRPLVGGRGLVEPADELEQLAAGGVEEVVATEGPDQVVDVGQRASGLVRTQLGQGDRAVEARDGEGWCASRTSYSVTICSQSVSAQVGLEAWHAAMAAWSW